MRPIAEVLPLTHVTGAIRTPWLGLGNGAWHLAVVVGVLMVSALGRRQAARL